MTLSAPPRSTTYPRFTLVFDAVRFLGIYHRRHRWFQGAWSTLWLSDLQCTSHLSFPLWWQSFMRRLSAGDLSSEARLHLRPRLLVSCHRSFSMRWLLASLSYGFSLFVDEPRLLGRLSVLSLALLTGALRAPCSVSLSHPVIFLQTM